MSNDFSPQKYPVIRIAQDSTKKGIIDLNYYDHPLPKNIYICSERELPEFVAEGYLPAQAFKDETYIASPYGEKQFIPIQNYETYVMNKKAHHVAMIAAKLGASGCIYSISLDSLQKRDVSANFNTKYSNSFNIDAAYRSQIESKIKNEISVQQQYTGKIPTEADYEDAYEYARIHNLLNDNSVEQLLNGRNPRQNNWCKSCDITVHLCEELNNKLDIAANLAVMNDAFTFSGNYVTTVMRKIEANLKLNYIFPTPETTVPTLNNSN